MRFVPITGPGSAPLFNFRTQYGLRGEKDPGLFYLCSLTVSTVCFQLCAFQFYSTRVTLLLLHTITLRKRAGGEKRASQSALLVNYCWRGSGVTAVAVEM